MSYEKKEFKTHGEQLKILKSRDLNIFPTIESYKILKKTNYYNLINGYKEPFLRTGTKDEKYIKGSSLMEIYSLYKFDKNIRSIYLEEVLKVEDLIKSAVAYIFSKEYGYEDNVYLNRNNFEDATGYKNAEINDLISKLMRLIWRHNDVQPYIKHYRDEHKYLPLWVLVNSMTFGDISKFYSYMKVKDRTAVSKELSINTNVLHGQLNNYLKMIGVYRNILAHDERFYEYQKKDTNGRPYTINFGKYLSLDRVHSSVFALTICLRILLEKKDFKIFLYKLFNEISILENKLVTITIIDILKRMNFIIPSKGLHDFEDIQKLLEL